jgi:hypothetical protein
MRKSLRPLAAIALAIGVATISSSSAVASAPTGDYAQFQYCPYQNTAVNACLRSVTTSGAMKLGTSTVPITNPITLQGGFTYDDATGLTQWFNAGNGGVTLSSSPQNVPGGLAGLVNPGGFLGLLEQAFENAVASANGVTATAELAGNVQFNYINLLFQSGPAVTLPLKVKLDNPFLGSNCYIGSNSSPVTLQLTVGTTSPPAGTAPIQGSPGVQTTDDLGTIAYATGIKLVDNAFSVPAATNCGATFIDRPLVTAAVNLKQGLPSPAGNNYAIQQGNSAIADTPPIRASVQ